MFVRGRDKHGMGHQNLDKLLISEQSHSIRKRVQVHEAR